MQAIQSIHKDQKVVIQNLIYTWNCSSIFLLLLKFRKWHVKSYALIIQNLFKIVM
jgi:hypothetical protein